MARSNNEKSLHVFALVALISLLAGCVLPSVNPQNGFFQNTNANTQSASECKLQSDGQNVCGYNCETGSNGKVYCADTPDGKCAFNSDGTWTCTQLAGGGESMSLRTAAPIGTQQPAIVPSNVPTECKLQSNGQKVCGYNCRLGSNGRAYCSSIPNGKCSLNSDGTFACP